MQKNLNLLYYLKWYQNSTRRFVMSKKNFKLLSFKRLILFFVLLAAFLTACNGNAQEGKNKNSAKRIQQEEKEISQTHGEKKSSNN